MEGSSKGRVKKEAISYLEKAQAEYAQYLRGKYFSDKDIYGDEIFDKTTTIDGITFKASRFSPTKSYADPVAFLNEVAEFKNKSVADKKNTKKKSIRPLTIDSESTRSSDSLQEISVDVWNEVQSARKVAGSNVGPFYKG
ncbi:hypothetical protein LXL04_033257 [Taraxacum kok-saghyz]